MDCGELKFRFALTPGDPALPRQAAQLEQPPCALLAAPTAGVLGRRGSLAALQPATLQLLALKRATDGNGLVVRVRETAGRDGVAVLTWLGRTLRLGPVRAGTIASWRLTSGRNGWRAKATDIAETR